MPEARPASEARAPPDGEVRALASGSERPASGAGFSATDALQLLHAELSELRTRCASLESRLNAKESECCLLREELRALKSVATAPAPAS